MRSPSIHFQRDLQEESNGDSDRDDKEIEPVEESCGKLAKNGLQRFRIQGLDSVP